MEKNNKISYQKLIQLLDISLVYDDGWSYDGNYCKKEIYSNKLVGSGMPYPIGYVVIDVNTFEVSTELNDFYNPIYTKKEFEDISISILKKIKERLSEFKKEANKND